MSEGTYERYLVNALTEAGRPALRAPTSGAATDRALPDVIAGTKYRGEGLSMGEPPVSEVWAIELKTTKATTAYFKYDEVSDLSWFSNRFGARMYLAARFKRPGKRSPYYLVRPSEARLTPQDNYGVPESDAEERANYLVYSATENEPAAIEVVV